MIKTNAKDVAMHIDPLSWSASMRLLWGNTVQVGDGSPDGYMPSRKAIPCVILPVVSVSDPERFQDGMQELAACKWYEGVPLPDNSNLITAETLGYTVLMDDDRKYALKITKDIPPHQPVIIHCKFSFLDVRTDQLIDIERQVMLRTVTYDANLYHLQLADTPSVTIIAPLEETGCGESPWLHTVSAQLFSGKSEIADAKAVYSWTIFDDRTHSFRNFTADEKQLMVKGETTKSLQFDARFFEKAVFCCTAKPTGQDVPDFVTNDLLKAKCAVQVKMPDTLEADIDCFKGFRVGPRMNTEVGYKVLLKFNKGDIPVEKYGLFRIKWRAIDAANNNKAIDLGEGPEIRFVPEELGYTRKSIVRVQADVSIRTHSGFMVNSSNKAILTADGKLLITNIYK